MNASRQVMLETARGPVAELRVSSTTRLNTRIATASASPFPWLSRRKPAGRLSFSSLSPVTPGGRRRPTAPTSRQNRLPQVGCTTSCTRWCRLPMGRFSTSVASTTGRISGPMLPTAMAPPRGLSRARYPEKGPGRCAAPRRPALCAR